MSFQSMQSGEKQKEEAWAISLAAILKDFLPF